MKISLRNLLMGTALAVSSIAFADAPFTVTTDFVKLLSTGELGNQPSTEIRTGTGVKGKVYAVDKASLKLLAIDANGVTVVRTDLPKGIGTAIGADDAGNILIQRGWAGATGLTDLSIIPADGSAIQDITITYPEGFTPKRTDNFGRITGDMLSADGAIFFMTTNESTTIAGVHIAEGQQVAATFEYASTEVSTAPESQSTACPMFNTVQEQLDADPIYDAFYSIRRGSQFITNYSGTEESLPRPTTNQNGEGIYYNGMPGGDTFWIGDVQYFVIPCMKYDKNTMGGTYQGGFVISDIDGNCLWTTDWDTDIAPQTGYGNGGNVIARVIDEYTVQIYAYFPTSTGYVTAAMYTLAFPEPAPAEPAKAYLVGAPSGWAAPTADNAATYADYALTETEAGNGIYNGKFEVAQGNAMFRIYMQLNGWELTESEQYGMQEADAPVDCAFTDGVFESTLVAGKGSLNFASWNGGSMDITFDYNTKAIKIVATENEPPAPVKPTLYITGEFDNWALNQEMTAEETTDEVIYTYTLPDEFTGNFKIATASWTMAYGNYDGVTFENGVPVAAYASASTGESNMYFGEAKATNIVVKLVLDATTADFTPKTITLSWTEYVEPSYRNAYAYGLSIEADANTPGTYNVKYTLAEAATEATLVLTNVEDATKVYRVPMSTPVVGENTFAYTLAQDVADGQYNYAVEVLSKNVVGEAPVVVYNYEMPAFIEGTSNRYGRGGLVVITDPEYDSFGYVMWAMSRNYGTRIFDPAGNQTAIVEDGWGATNNSGPLRGDQRFGKGVFASWADGTSGAYYLDPLKPETGFVQLAQGERDAAGIFTYDGVQTISSTPCVAFTGKGEETVMWTFDEDIYGNMVASYPIGNEEFLGAVAGTSYAWTKSPLANTAVCFEPSPVGLFAGQNRADGMDISTPGFILFDFNGEKITDCYEMMSACGYTLPSANGAVAVSTDNTLLAVGTYSSVVIFAVDFTAAVPTIEYLYEVAMPATAKFAQAKFDAGNNLHIAGINISGYTEAYYCIVSLPGENVATTAGKSADVIAVTDGIENISIDAIDVEAVYYNLNGVRVNAADLTPGIYVKVAGNTATKVIVR